jgi:hypothetical protein
MLQLLHTVVFWDGVALSTRGRWSVRHFFFSFLYLARSSQFTTSSQKLIVGARGHFRIFSSLGMSGFVLVARFKMKRTPTCLASLLHSTAVDERYQKNRVVGSFFAFSRCIFSDCLSLHIELEINTERRLRSPFHCQVTSHPQDTSTIICV